MATTINAANISVGFDAKKLKEGTTLARSEITQLARNLRESVPPVAKLQKQQENLYAAFKAGAISVEQYTRTLTNLDAKIDALNPSIQQAAISAANLDNAWKRASGAQGVTQLTKQVQAMENAWKKASSAIGATQLTKQAQQAALNAQNLNAAWEKAAKSVGQYTAATRQALEGTTKVSAATMAAVNRRSGSGLFGELAMMAGSRAGLAGGVAGLVAGAAGGAVNAQMEAEKAVTTFSVLTGSIEKGTAAFQQMRQIAQTFPIRLQDLQQAGQTMLAFGVATEDLIPSLKQIGEITGGDSLRFQMLSLAFAQSSAAGRLMGQDLLQMVNAGFNPLQVISQKTGKSIAELRKDMEGGLITFDMVTEAFRSATAEGGKFNGMLAAQSNTIGGQWRATMGQLNNLMLQIGETVGPALVVGMQSAQGVLMTVNAGVAKLKEGIGFVYSGLLDIVTLDFSATNTNAYLDSLKQAELSAEAITEAKKEEKVNQEAIVSGYQKIVGIEKELETLLDRRHSQDQIRHDLFRENFETIQKLKMGEEAFMEAKRRNLGWTESELLALKQQESIIKSLQNAQQAREQASKDAAKLQEDLLKKQQQLGEQATTAARQGSTDKTSPDLIKAGSAEAYRFVMNKSNEQLKKLEEQKRIQAMQLEVQRRIQLGIDRLNPMVAVG